MFKKRMHVFDTPHLICNLQGSLVILKKWNIKISILHSWKVKDSSLLGCYTNLNGTFMPS